MGEQLNLYKEAHACLKLGLFPDAHLIYTKILDLKPRDPIALHNLGTLAILWGKFDEAFICFSACCDVDPGNDDFMLGLLQASLLVSNERAVGVITNLSLDLREPIANRTTSHSEFLFSNQDNLFARYLLEILRQSSMGRPNNALSLAKEAQKTFGENALLNFSVGLVLLQARSFELAKLNFEKVLKLGISLPELDIYRAECDLNLGNVTKAISDLESLLEGQPTHSTILHHLSRAYLLMGNKEEARKHLITLSDSGKNYVFALSELLNLDRGPETIDILQRVQKLLDETDENEQFEAHTNLNFALAKYYARAKKYDESFTYYEAANNLKKRKQPYSVTRYLKKLKTLDEFYEKIEEDCDNLKPSSRDKIHPIFVVGMPRSGTSLTEQILSQHSEIFGAGELSEIGRLLNQAINKKTDTVKNISDIRGGYFSHLTNLSKKHFYFVDKTPTNFQFLPLIFWAFPEAKVIHLKRDARAVCWSNFCQNFANPNLQYSNDFNQTVEYYNIYHEMMRKYEGEYGDRIFHLNYEDLTNQPETHIRNLLNYIGVEFEEQCLSPENNEKAMLTASRDQVRKPIYKGSSDLWRNYEKYIGKYFEKLKNW